MDLKTPCILSGCGGFNRSAHSAGPVSVLPAAGCRLLTTGSIMISLAVPAWAVPRRLQEQPREVPGGSLGGPQGGPGGPRGSLGAPCGSLGDPWGGLWWSLGVPVDPWGFLGRSGASRGRFPGFSGKLWEVFSLHFGFMFDVFSMFFWA